MSPCPSSEHSNLSFEAYRRQMQEKVELQVIARFGKRDGASDYSWLVGRENVPPQLFNVCEPLARLSVSAGTYISLVAKEGDESYLVRAFRQGVDNAYRTIAAVEVALIVSPRQLSLEHWLGLAVVGIQTSERERIGEAAQYTILVPPPQVEPVEPDREQLVSARLGLPITAPIRVALSLLKLRPWRYRGICFALSGKQDAPLGWSDELAPYLCINFAEPRLSDIESSLLDAALSRQITQAEWDALVELPQERVREALQWSLHPTTPSPVLSSEAELLPWLVAFRASSQSGAELLRALRHDVSPHILPADVVREIMRDVSTEAVSFMLALERGEAFEPRLEVIEELGGQGYLADEQTVPLSAWAKYASSSPTVAQHALQRFSHRDLSLSSAQFVLNLDVADQSVALSLNSLNTAARVAVDYGLPAPRGRLMQILQNVTWPDQVPLLEELGNIYGGWVSTLAQLIVNGSIPPEGILTPDEISIALEVRARVLGIPTALLEVLAMLIKDERREEAAQLLETSQATHAARIGAAAYKVLQARLGRIPPSPPPPPISELKLLARLGLARPTDIVPEERDELKLIEYAQIWPATMKLVGVIQSTDVQSQEMPWFPESWASAVRRALNSSRSALWLQKLDAPVRHSALSWLADLHGFDSQHVEALCGGDVALEGQIKEDILPWLSAYALSLTRAQCLRGLSNAVSTGIARGDELMAGNFVRALFPQINEKDYLFASYTLSRVGPFPMLLGVTPDLIVALSPWLEPLLLIDAIFVSTDTTLSNSPDVAGALVRQLREKSTPYPAYGYTIEQRQQHLTFAATLSTAPGWGALAPDESSRLRYAKRLLNQLGLKLQDSHLSLSGETEDEVVNLTTPIKEVR
jgi:hypothetical protein